MDEAGAGIVPAGPAPGPAPQPGARRRTGRQRAPGRG